MESNIFSRFSFNANTATVGVEENVNASTVTVGVEENVNAEEVDIEDFNKCSSSPPNWRDIISAIRSMRANQDAPVDQMGTHQLADGSADKKIQQFQLLVAAVISSQTRDSVTAAAMMRLHALPGGLNILSLCKEELTINRLAEILKPVGFYRQKAKYLKAIAEKLLASPYDGCVPCTMRELLKLPGVGPKVALLVLWVAFGKGEEGFIVDTNVRRVCCRLGWAPDGSDPSQVRQALETWIPRSLWPDISFLLVGFGQQVCKPIAPQCGSCQVNGMCPSALQDSVNGTSKKRSKLQEVLSSE